MVTKHPIHPEQSRLEKKATALFASRPDPDRTVEEVFGPIEDWIFEIGDGWKLMLVPFLQRWWYFDRVHDDWQDAGCAIGGGRFHVEGGLLTLEKDEAKLTNLPPQSGASVAHFCSQCGTAVTPGDRFCRKCGFALLN